MSELAFNINGEGFEVPAHATGWRVRRMRAKGSPEVVYGRDGLPLVLPIDAELDDLKSEVNITGRYRLDLVDQNNKAIADVPSGYVQVNPDAATSTNGSTASSFAHSYKPTDNIVIEAMRTQSAMALAVIERFPQMMDSAANLLRAADGAGLPAREPRESVDDEVDDDEMEPAPGAAPAFDLGALLAQVIPLVLANLGGGMKLPGLGEMLDWRKAVPKPAKASKAESSRTQESKSDAANSATSSSAATVPENANDVIPPIDPQTMAHFIAVQTALTAEEGAIAREMAKELSAAELRAWFAELSSLSVPEAVAKVRKLISGFGKNGGAS